MERIYVPGIVGQHLPIRYSFLSLLKNFRSTNQSLTGGSIAVVSETPAVADFDLASGGLVSSDQGIADGIPNDAVVARFHMIAAGQATIKITVDAINPTATYVGVFTFQVEDVPTP